ncbi:MAG TPA: hypothetical protein VFM34_09185 [Moraxellaceae bacterium]|nr:hypothetical protein [Moraxellaceae bacterium]
MIALWALFWSVCLMRRGPDDVPYSLPLLALAIALSVGLGVVTQFLSGSESLPGMAAVLISPVVDALALWALLAFKRQEPLFVPSLTAVFGADLLLGLFALPLVLASHFVGESPLLPVVVFGQMLLVGWNLGVRGFIYHRSAHIGIVQANVLALTLFVLNIFFVVKLFPELLGPAGPH